MQNQELRKQVQSQGGAEGETSFLYGDPFQELQQVRFTRGLFFEVLWGLESLVEGLERDRGCVACGCSFIVWFIAVGRDGHEEIFRVEPRGGWSGGGEAVAR